MEKNTSEDRDYDAWISPNPISKSPSACSVKKVAPLVNAHAFYIPGNGKYINMWVDCIMNKLPLA